MAASIKNLEQFGNIPHEGTIKYVSRVAWLCVGLGFIVAGHAAYLIWREIYVNGQTTMTVLSSYGSYLQGTVQSLWSLAAFLFVFVAFLGQKQQLKMQAYQFNVEQRLQEEQGRQQQIELENQRQQFQIQQDSIRRQNFENSFFQLLGLHNQIALGMRDLHPPAPSEPSASPIEIVGRDCFEAWFNSLKSEFWGFEFKDDTSGNPIIEKRPNSVDRYMAFYRAYQGTLGHYFRNLYHVFRFIDENDALRDADEKVEYKRRRLYTSLVRATLSQFELALLFYNCVSPNGEKFTRLLKKYELLENFDFDSLIEPDDRKLLDDDGN